MNSMNRAMIEETVNCLRDGSSRARLLEVGFGGGVGLSSLAETFPSATIVGVESSSAMIALARRQMSRLIDTGRLELWHGRVEDLRFLRHCFDGVCTVNTVYFWSDPKRSAEELARVLTPGGLLAIGLRSRDSMSDLAFTRHGFTLYDVEQVAELVASSGLIDVQVRNGDDDGLGFACVTGIKPMLG